MSQDNQSHSDQLMRLLAYLQRDPENNTLRVDIFEHALAMGAFDEAGLQMSHARRTRPEDPAWKHREATLYLACGQYEHARDTLQGLLDEGFNEAGTRYNLAYAQFRLGLNEVARDMAAPLRQESAEVAALAWSLWLRCQHHLYQLDEALKAFTEALPLSTMGPDAWGVASLIALDSHRAQEAQTWADHALAEYPEQSEALVTSGTLALGRQDTQLAQKLLEQALRKNEKDGRILSGLAFTEMLKLNFPAALETFGRALTYMPDHIGTWIGLGWCRFVSNDVKGAQAAFERGLALDRNFGESHGGLAVVLAAQGDRVGAERELTIALKLDHKNLSARFAESILSGEVANAEAFQRMAHRLLSQRPSGIEGETLADVVLKRRKM